MELIQALEQLSLEVRNQQANSISTSNEHNVQLDDPNRSSYSQNLGQDFFKRNSQPNWQYPSSSLSEDSNHQEVQIRLQQLQEFENSIDTLFVQLTDLNCNKINHDTQLQLNHSLSSVFDRRTQFRRQRNIYRQFNHVASGSMETSQEEDSDCSSQQSSSNGHTASSCLSSANQTTSLVKDLLRRDISAITDTVRRISRILSIGNEIETFYINLSCSQTSDPSSSSNKRFLTEKLDLHYVRSLCSIFNDLCSSEVHIKDLPTIKRYVYYCAQLVGLLNTPDDRSFRESARPQTQTLLFSGNADVDADIDDDVIASSSFDRSVCEDASVLDCNQMQVNNWTENKLYIDNSFSH